jgi:hypothetical protein
MTYRAQLLSVLAFAIIAGAASGETIKHQPNPRLAAMPPHSWLRLGDAPPAPKGIMAYSGGVFDSEHNVFLVFGGGHADYWGNEVCAFDMKTLAWRRMYEPDARARYTNDNIDNQRGKLKDSDKPYTRHSYQMLAFVPSVKKMFIWSGCGPGWGNIAPTCPAPPDAWYYDFVSNKWEFAAANGPKCYGGGTAYDAKRDVIWALPARSWSPLFKFDVKTSAWSKHTLKPEIPAHCHLNLAYNANRDLIVAAQGDNGKTCHLINPNNLTAEKVDTSDYQTVGYGGMIVLPDQDVALHLKGDPALGVLDFDSRKWFKLDGPEGGPKMLGYAVYGRLRYSPIDKVALFVGPAGVWAYKPPAKYDLKALAARAASQTPAPAK